MEYIVTALAIFTGIVGIIGSIIPGLPGIHLSWVGMLLLYFWGGNFVADNPMSPTFLLVWLGIVLAISVIDYFIPGYFTKLSGGSKYASRGAMAGLIIGIIFTPIGMIIGSFLGALLSEMYYANKKMIEALKPAFGAFVGFIAGTGLKTIVACVMLIYIIMYI